MKKPTSTKNPTAAKMAPAPAGKAKRQGYGQLVSAISAINTQMVGRAATAVNQLLVLRNWMVGAYIVEFEQQGADRAKYGAKLLPTLAEDLKKMEVKGLGIRTLRDCRTFFTVYPEIRQALFAESTTVPIRQALLAEFSKPGESSILQTPFAKLTLVGGNDDFASTACKMEPQPRGDFVSTADKVCKPMLTDLPSPLEPEQLARLSWAHFLELIRLDDPWKRAFYENEIIQGHWSQRQLQRQIGSLLYERTGLSTNKKAVIQRARKQEPQESIADVLRDPYILEFTGLAERPEYSEGELESALLDHVQKFLLELGRGFCFEARQFRMTEGRKHHRVDLVFYHRLLRSHVLIDLKIRAFKPEDAGQMNFYVNWFKANMLADGDNPPVGILLCSDKDGAEVEFATAGMDQKLFVTRYLTALPSAEQLKAFLERDRDEIKALIRSKESP